MNTVLLGFLLLAAPQEPARDIHGDPLPTGAVARLGRLAFGHYRDIYGNALSGDGKTLATGGCDESIRIWDVPSGGLRRIIDTRRTFVIALTQDGSIMASASSHDKATRIHDTRTGLEIGRLDGEANSLSFSLDGARLAAAFGRGTPVRIYDAASLKVLKELPAATEPHGAVAFFDGGKRLATAGRDKTLKIWNAETGEELRSATLELAAYRVVPSPDSKLLALSCVVNEGPGAAAVLLFDSTSATERRRLEGHSDMVLVYSFTSDSKKLLTAGKDRVIRMWDIDSETELKSFEGHTHRISGIHVLPGNDTFLSLSDDKTIRLWDIPKGREVPVRADSIAQMRDLAWSPDGLRIATAGHEGRVIVWEAQTGKEVLALKGHEGQVPTVAWSPDGSRIATAGDDGTVRFWDATSGASVKVVGAGGGAATSLAYSPDGSRLAGTGTGMISGWDAATGERRFQQAVPDIIGRWGGLPTVAYSPDGSTIAVTSERGLRLFDAADGKELMIARGSDLSGVTFIPGREAALAFPSQGRYLAILDSDRPWFRHTADNTLALYRAEKPGMEEDLMARGLRLSFHEYQKEFRYSDYAWGMKGIAASRDGRYLATGSSDGSVRVFETLTGAEAKRLKWHYGSTDRAAFSPDGRLLAALSWGECSALVWNLRPPATYRAADFEKHWEALAGRNGSEAYDAQEALVAGGQPVALELEQRLKAGSSDTGFDRVVADLDHEELDRREAASSALRKAGVHALPEIRKALEKKPSDEARRRMAEILAEFEGTVLRDPEAVRRLRTLAILERLGATDAIETLSRESPSHRERKEAASALKRLKR